jgi:hypothetical protein
MVMRCDKSPLVLRDVTIYSYWTKHFTILCNSLKFVLIYKEQILEIKNNFSKLMAESGRLSYII